MILPVRTDPASAGETHAAGHDELSGGILAASYVVPNSWEHARRRLELLEACYDAASFRRASALGVRAGWRCLDAGAGHGSFARWLGSQVGPAGSVIAADLDTRLLADITEANIEVRQMDLVDLADEQRWFTGPAMMTAWGQRPPG